MLLACSPPTATIPSTMERPLRFLALGDSYTIGEGVDTAQSWPYQLTTVLQNEGFELDEPTIIARTGWTTGDLRNAIEETDPQGPFDLVTLLIGVNNQYQGKDPEIYRQEFHILLGMAVDFAGENPE